MPKCAQQGHNCSCLNRVYGKDYVPKGQNHRERTLLSIHRMGCVTYMSSNIDPVSNKKYKCPRRDISCSKICASPKLRRITQCTRNDSDSFLVISFIY